MNEKWWLTEGSVSFLFLISHCGLSHLQLMEPQLLPWISQVNASFCTRTRQDGQDKGKRQTTLSLLRAVPVQASAQAGPRHTPPRHSPSRRPRSSSSGSQTWACWQSFPSPGASPSPCAPPEGTCNADRSSWKQQRREVRGRPKPPLFSIGLLVPSPWIPNYINTFLGNCFLAKASKGT